MTTRFARLGFRERVVVPIALAGITLALYLPAVGCDFVNYDDPLFVIDNPHVNTGLSVANAAWAFGIHGPSQYHPLTWLSHMLDVELFALEPGGHHLVNVLLHAAATVALYSVLATATGAPWRSAVVAALFGWHPTRVESVAWIAERKDVLCALFSLLTVGAYVRHVRRTGWTSYALVVAAYALALASKPMAVTVPALLLLLDYWPLERLTLHGTPPRRAAVRLLVEKAPLLIMALAAAWLSYLCQVEAKAVMSLDELPPAQRVANALIACVRYLRMTILPTQLAVFYPREPWRAWQAVVACGVLVAITATVVCSRKRYAIAGWLWFLLSLAPVIGLLQVGDQALADRYTYLPLVGIFILITWSLAEVAARSAAARRAVVYLAGAALVTCALATSLQLTHWRDGAALFAHAIDVTRGNYLAHYNLGVVLAQRGQLAEATGQYALALRYKPQYLDAHVNLGAALEMLGDRAGAERHYRVALRLDPTDADARANLDALLAGHAGPSTSTSPAPPVH